MNPPSLADRALGHPIVAVPLLFGGTATAVVCFYHSGDGGVLPGILFLVLLGRVLKANEAATAYRRWCAAWNGMADPAPHPPGRWGRLLKPLAGFAMLALLASYADAAIVTTWLAGAMAIGITAGVVLFAKRLRRRSGPRPGREEVVQIVARPVLPVPSLADAYRALPDYCGTLP